MYVPRKNFNSLWKSSHYAPFKYSNTPQDVSELDSNATNYQTILLHQNIVWRNKVQIGHPTTPNTTIGSSNLKNLTSGFVTSQPVTITHGIYVKKCLFNVIFNYLHLFLYLFIYSSLLLSSCFFIYSSLSNNHYITLLRSRKVVSSIMKKKNHP